MPSSLSLLLSRRKINNNTVDIHLKKTDGLSSPFVRTISLKPPRETRSLSICPALFTPQQQGQNSRVLEVHRTIRGIIIYGGICCTRKQSIFGGVLHPPTITPSLSAGEAPLLLLAHVILCHGMSCASSVVFYY